MPLTFHHPDDRARISRETQRRRWPGPRPPPLDCPACRLARTPVRVGQWPPPPCPHRHGEAPAPPITHRQRAEANQLRAIGAFSPMPCFCDQVGAGPTGRSTVREIGPPGTQGSHRRWAQGMPGFRSFRGRRGAPEGCRQVAPAPHRLPRHVPREGRGQAGILGGTISSSGPHRPLTHLGQEHGVDGVLGVIHV